MPEIFFGMTRVFKVFCSFIFEESGETDVGSAETQPIEG